MTWHVALPVSRDRGSLLRRALLLLVPIAVLVSPALPASAVAAAPPGIGHAWSTYLAGHNQVVVASGDGRSSDRVTVTLYNRHSNGWVRVGSWRGYNGLQGWTTSPSSSTMATPVGVFTLTAAGGYSASPSTKLPYDHSLSRYSLISHGVRTFNHVIAIDYNHVPGSAPTDARYPLGARAGYHFWLHTAHNSGSGGCVTVPDAGVVIILQKLDPRAHPVIAMAPASVLAR